MMRWARIAIVLLAAAWLFGDTVRHYWPERRDPHVIRFAHFGTYQDYNTWGAVIAAFEAKYPKLEVRQEYVTGWYGHYDTKLRQQLLAGTCPHMVLVQPGPFASIADRFADLGALPDTASAQRDGGICLRAYALARLTVLVCADPGDARRSGAGLAGAPFSDVRQPGVG
jgi:ABC-type glycerol-3-phosphate transport system substrate-binding protein